MMVGVASSRRRLGPQKLSYASSPPNTGLAHRLLADQTAACVVVRAGFALSAFETVRDSKNRLFATGREGVVTEMGVSVDHVMAGISEVLQLCRYPGDRLAGCSSWPLRFPDCSSGASLNRR